MGKLDRPYTTRYTTEMPAMGDAPLPVAPYVSRAFFELEREKVFRRAWLEVARVEDVPDPGDYRVVDIDVLGWSLLLTRGSDGALRAFHNVCPHRGNKVVQHRAGHANGFTCGFHGWVFGNDGELKHMAGEAYFPPGTDRCRLGLIPVTLDTWNGFVFIHPQAEPPQTLRDFLGGMADQIEDFPFDRCARIARYEATPRANWKVVLDAFQEAFHAIMVHRGSLPDSAAAPQNPSAAPTSARFHGPHRSLSVWASPRYRPPEVGMIVGKYGPTFATAKDRFAGINPDGDDSWWFDINVFFPNFFCDTGPGWYFTYNFWPVSENRTRWTMDIYQLRAPHAGGLLAQEHTKILLRDAVLEDFSTLEATQQMMESGALTHITISELEIALRHQMHIIDQWLAA
ncbi:aromatic ring-hydroxylating oxygenase subunit alpha [Immundisolibacter sp.]|uniref:aromatic ring-hydroxylating oxygenase subunit alpha n=1 Tax=Immundisolibacter sp. TaxID=1934948 RepID=UPI003F835EBD